MVQSQQIKKTAQKSLLTLSGFLFLTLLLAGCSGFSSSKYKEYLSESENSIKALPPERKEKREQILQQLKTNSVYKDLVENKSTSSEYLPVLSVIASGVSSISPDGFVLSQEAFTSSNGEEKKRFAAIVTSLAIKSSNGGVPKEIIDVFVRYKDHYNIYGDKGVWVDANTNETHNINAYDLSPFFGIIDPQNTEVLNKIYEAKQKGLSEWENVDYPTFSYLSSKKGYLEYIRAVYPESPYNLKIDYELTARQLYEAYNENEISADEKFKDKKVAVAGVIDDLTKDIMGNAKVSLRVGILQSVICDFGDKIKLVSKLSKGDKIIVIGNCDGFVMRQVILEDCELW